MCLFTVLLSDVTGHVDAGKSTMMGHLLFQLGFVDKRSMHKYEQESRKRGKASFAFAWVLDETEEERERGVTMDIAQSHFETETKLVRLLDAPGHKDFIPNMITGSLASRLCGSRCQRNARRVWDWLRGWRTDARARYAGSLARLVFQTTTSQLLCNIASIYCVLTGVSQLVVAVNKMDTVDCSKVRFDEVVRKLEKFLRLAGFKV